MITTPSRPRTRTATTSQRLLTLRQTAQEYGMPERSTYDLILRNALAAVRFPGSRRIWVDRHDVEALIAASKELRA
jgi:predicted DNA-binding transcriptional regulator AlpA